MNLCGAGLCGIVGSEPEGTADRNWTCAETENDGNSPAELLPSLARTPTGTGAMTRRRVWLAGLLAVTVLAVLAAVSVTSGTTSAPTAGRGAPPVGSSATGSGLTDPIGQARLGTVRRVPGDPLALGSVTAPVVIVEWGDFQCPYCRAFTVDTEPVLLRQYVDSGQVRLEWHDFAYLGPESVRAARAARAAGRQGRFWAFHDALYRDQSRENSGAVTDASLTTIARSLRLNVAQFQRDYADPTIAAQVAADQQDGGRLGITGVPSFLIGSQLIFGAQPLPTFEQAINAALNQGR